MTENVRLYMDGNEVCALIGPDLQEGIAGFGYTTAEALRDLAQAVENVGGLSLLP